MGLDYALHREQEVTGFSEVGVTDKAASTHKMLLGNREPEVRSKLCTSAPSMVAT